MTAGFRIAGVSPATGEAGRVFVFLDVLRAAAPAGETPAVRRFQSESPQ